MASRPDPPVTCGTPAGLLLSAGGEEVDGFAVDFADEALRREHLIDQIHSVVSLASRWMCLSMLDEWLRNAIKTFTCVEQRILSSFPAIRRAEC